MTIAITWAIIAAIMGLLFVMLMYLIFAIITSIIKNVGKDKFTWYAITLDTASPQTVSFDSFSEMIKFGLVMDLKLSAVMTVLAFLVCIYVEIKG